MQYINGWSIYPYEYGYRGAKDNGKDAFGVRKKEKYSVARQRKKLN